MQQATFGGGCFWCLEPIFQEVKGVAEVKSGYSGGDVENPSYEQVSTGDTNHAEVVQITFDTLQLKFEDLLYIFFRIHDPTTLNRQGNDIGTQYRSVIFYHTEDQRESAEKYINKISEEKLYDEPIVTQLVPFTKFFEAEDYHQDFYNKNKEYPYCRIVIDPKVKKYREEIKQRFS